MSTSIVSYSGDDIKKTLKKFGNNGNKKLFHHMYEAIKDPTLLPHLELKVEQAVDEKAYHKVTTFTLIDTRTNEIIKP